MNSSPQHWTLDKRVPITLILTLAVQTVAIGIWLGTVQARLNYVEGYIDSRIQDGPRLAVLETKMSSIEEALRDIRDDLRKVTQR